MKIKHSTKVAVLDLTHGGVVLARKLKKIAAYVAAIDVYKKLSQESLDELEKEGIKTSLEPIKASQFDILVAPVHLYANYTMLADAASNNIPVISHHQAVGQLLSKYDFKNRKIIEITGTKAKTSTSILLAEILSSKKKVISHTSRGLEDWSTGTILMKGLSITPASMLTALDHLHYSGIDFDVLIAEISLGGTGFADIGIITTISNDYKIAKNTGLASAAKRRMILDAKPESVIIANNDALRYFGSCRRDIEIISFTDTVNASCNVYYENMDANSVDIAYFLGREHGRIHIKDAPDYDITSYKTAFVCAAAAAIYMKVDIETIERTFREFKGAEGRMKKKALEGRILIDNSNSGMDIRTAEKALVYSKKEGGRIVMVLGEEAKEVCEGLDPEGVEMFINKHLNEISVLVLIGERMKNFVNINPGKIHHANNLQKGLELSKSLTRENDIILSCVKCFR